ncbi:MAG: hemolysin family protein [Alphaproteobacteria bacterium]|nr:hemolysin family protein [Alphaproteobacteria bacterium]
MNHPILDDTTSRDIDADEPRTWWQRAWHALRYLWHAPPDAEVLREVVEELIEEPLSESGLTQGERLLLGNIINLRERKTGDCMVQRADIIAADVSSTLKEIADLMAVHAHSRIPAYRDTLDDVIGMVHIKDVMPCLTHQHQRTVADLIRPVLFVAPSMPVAKLLLQMRQTRQHMAMVVDEFGGVDGLVTIEDLVEEIVGEIDDEHDAPPAPPIITRADGTLLVDARLPIEEFEEQTGMTLPELDGEDIDTLGGYVTHIAGRVPQIGESFRHGDGLRFDVLEMDQSRIKRLRIRGSRRAAAPAGAVKA